MGSTDLHVCESGSWQANPLQVSELDMPGAIKTGRSGGSYVYKAAVETVLAGICGLDLAVRDLHRDGSEFRDRRSLESAVAEFEEEKRPLTARNHRIQGRRVYLIGPCLGTSWREVKKQLGPRALEFVFRQQSFTKLITTWSRL